MGNQITPRKLNIHAQDVIRRAYLIGSAPAEPHKALTDLARSVTIFGEMLQSISDEYGKVGEKFASSVAYAGKLFWGIVEVSVPSGVFRHLLQNWLSLFALVSVVTIGLGLLTSTSGMSGVGVGMLILVVLLAVFSGILRYYMITAEIPPRFFLISRAGLLFAVLSFLAYLAIYHGQSVAKLLHVFERLFLWSAQYKKYLWGGSTTGA